jgi:DNA-binding response OmpR family regulator
MSLNENSANPRELNCINSQQCDGIRYAGLPEYQLSHGKLHVDLITQRVTYDGKRVVTTPTHFNLIVMLLLNAGAIVPKERITSLVCLGFETTDRNAASVALYRLRSNLVDAGAPKDLIETLRGKGVRFARGQG